MLQQSRTPVRYAAILALAAALAACGSSEGTGGQDTAEPADVAPAASVTPAVAAPGEGQMQMPVDQVTATTIPASIQGRWGMNEADCDPARDDNKGLMVVGATSVEFYESHGNLTRVEESDASGVRAAFAFTGEGMSWDRDMVLDVQDDGTVLIRRDYGDDAIPGPMRYMRCS